MLGGTADEVGNTIWQYETFSFQMTLNLRKGDEIWLGLQIDSLSGRKLSKYLEQIDTFIFLLNYFEWFISMFLTKPDLKILLFHFKSLT